MFDVKDNVDKEWYSARVSFWMKRYENFVGLTDVKEAQVRVVQTEKQFINSQENRRATQKAINDIQQVCCYNVAPKLKKRPYIDRP